MRPGLHEHPEGVLVDVVVAPRSQPEGLGGLRDGRWLVRVCAAPVDGAANEAVIAVVARSLRVGKRSVTVVSGQRSKRKRLLVAGVSPAEAGSMLTEGL